MDWGVAHKRLDILLYAVVPVPAVDIDFACSHTLHLVQVVERVSSYSYSDSPLVEVEVG
jgi:hypothetical protein